MNINVSFSFNFFALVVVTAFAYGMCLLGQIIGALLITPFMPSHMRAYPMSVAEEIIQDRFVKQLVVALVTTFIALQNTPEVFFWSGGVMGVVGLIYIVISVNWRS